MRVPWSSTLKHRIKGRPLGGVTLGLLVATQACFRPSPPLEEGDGRDSEFTTETDAQGRSTVKGHPVILKRRPTASTSGTTQSTEPSPQPISTTSTPTPTPAISIATPAPTPTPAGLNLINVTGLKPTLTGTCDPAATTFSATTTSGRVRSVTCAPSGVLSIEVHLPAGGDNFSVAFSQTRDDGSIDSKSTTYTRTAFTCPTGYVGVPRSEIEGLGHASAMNGHSDWWLDVSKDFCVMKYPAKNNNSSTYATSTTTKTPWSNLKRGIDENDPASAFKACSDVPTGTHRLISNTQWQTVARNAESVGANWSGGAVGSGVLNKGHTDNSAHSLPNSTDTDPYFETGNSENDPVGGGWEQKRTHVLSNGEIVWDFGGNIWQFVSDNALDIGMSPQIEYVPGYTSNAYFSIENHTTNRLLFAPNGFYGINENVGSIWGGNQAIRRAWYWSDYLNVRGGIFTATLGYSTTASLALTGFRCAALPQ